MKKKLRKIMRVGRTPQRLFTSIQRNEKRKKHEEKKKKNDEIRVKLETS